MPQKLEPGEPERSQQPPIAALKELAAFSLAARKLRFSPQEERDHWVGKFLERLVAHCGARQGALFFAFPRQKSAASKYSSEHPSRSESLSLITTASLQAEEAWMLLDKATRLSQVEQESIHLLPFSLLWDRPLEQIPSSPQEAGFAFSARILLVWDAANLSEQEDYGQALLLLPLLADLIDTILLQIHTAIYEPPRTAEVFPPELLATVGHEFRGPLTTIQGYATTLLRHDQQLAPAERLEFLQAITEASSHLGMLVQRFLELAQFETHTIVLDPAPVDLPALTRESISAMQQRTSRHLVFTPGETANDPGQPEREQEIPVLAGDRRLLRMMLDILLENAMLYSAPGSLVEVSLASTDATSLRSLLQTPPQEGKHRAVILPARFQVREPVLLLQVQDHGIGIEAEHLSLIFQRFYRVDMSMTRETNGLGLGLALCKAIVTLHRGMLWVESEIGKGSVFSLAFPLHISMEKQASSEF